MGNASLHRARRAKNDEFYTRYEDISKEIVAYVDYDKDVFRGKTVYCNCDDPWESNFFKYFALHFNRLGLKRLMSTSYAPSSVAMTELAKYGDVGQYAGRAVLLVIDEVKRVDGGIDLNNVATTLAANASNEIRVLGSNGDFRHEECVEILKHADVVVTNPPFSLFREFMAQVMEYDKKFLVIGNKNAVTYKEIFPLIKDRKLWPGARPWGSMNFTGPDGKPTASVPAIWFTNMEHRRRHEPLELMTREWNLRWNKRLQKKADVAYKRYDNYDAIEVPVTAAIPSDYDGVMGVPISFLDKYCPEQFTILGGTANGQVPAQYKLGEFRTYNNPILGGTKLYQRILIRRRK